MKIEIKDHELSVFKAEKLISTDGYLICIVVGNSSTTLVPSECKDLIAALELLSNTR